MTDPSIEYWSKFTDKELYKSWQLRVKMLQLSLAEKEELFPPKDAPYWEESVDRVEREIARRNLPVPGEDTFK